METDRNEPTPYRQEHAGATASKFSLRRFKIILRSGARVLIACTLVIASINAMQALTEIPFYVSTSKLQLESFELGRMVEDPGMAANEAINDSVRLNNALLVFQSETFYKQLAQEVQNSPDKGSLVLSWGIGRKLKLSYALYRLGLSKVEYQKVDPSKLNLEELRILLSSMIQVSAVPTDQTVEVKVSALEEKTAYLINRTVVTAFSRANQKIDADQFQQRISFLHDQGESAKQKLDVAEQKFADYIKVHVNASGDGVQGTFMSGFLALQMKKQEIEYSISADRQLLASVNEKLKASDTSQESEGEIFEALKSELLSLKYKRTKLLEQGYAKDHPGVTALDRSIANSDEFIRKSQPKRAADGKSIFGVTEYRKALAEKVFRIQDELVRQEQELKGVSIRLSGMASEVEQLPTAGMMANSLRGDVTRANELYSELTKRLEITRVRSQGGRNTLREVTAPNALTPPSTLPFVPRIVFGIFAGLLFGVSAVLVMDSIRPKLAVRADAESSGFKYAGLFGGSPDSCAEVLAALDCIYSDKSMDHATPVVLFGGASPAIQLQTFLPLIDYMGSRGENVLFVVESKNFMPDSASTETQMAGMKMHRDRKTNKDIIQISGAHDFGMIRLILTEYADYYDAIFLFVEKGSESSVYSLCRGIANRVLLVGEEGSHTVEEYRNISNGFGHGSQIYTALLPYSGREYSYQKSVWLNRLALKWKQQPREMDA